MNCELTLPEREALHNLINLRLYPFPHLHLGQVNRLVHGGATVRIERTGSMFAYGMDALTYRYAIAGFGFVAEMLVIYHDLQAATAFVNALSVSPDPTKADGTFLAWLIKLDDEERISSDPIFDQLFLG